MTSIKATVVNRCVTLVNRLRRYKSGNKQKLTNKEGSIVTGKHQQGFISSNCVCLFLAWPKIFNGKFSSYNIRYTPRSF